MTEAEDSGQQFGATSLNDLRRVHSNPFGFFGRVKHWLLIDEFRGICAGVIVGSFVLTLALIFDVAFGKSAVTPIIAIESSNPICTEFGKLHLEETRNTYDACILTCICLLAGARQHASLMSGGVATVHVINATEPPQYIDFSARQTDQPKPVFMAGMLKLKALAKQSSGYTYSHQPVIQLPLEELIRKAVKFIEDSDDNLKGSSDTHYTNNELIKQLNELLNDDQLYSSADVSETDMTSTTANILQTTIDPNDEELSINFTTDVTMYTTDDTKRIRLALNSLSDTSIVADIIDDEMLETFILRAFHQTAEVTNFDQTISLQVDEFFDNENLKPPQAWTSGYESAAVTAIGDDFTMIAIALTLGNSKTPNCTTGTLGRNTGTLCYPSFTDLENRMFPSPILIKRINSTCGVCGHYTALMGDPISIVDAGARIIKNRQVKDLANLNPSSYEAIVEWVPHAGMDRVNSLYKKSI